ncbi:MAG TPA: hypothetical protein PLD62_05535 [Candidatus Cloacimonadota bacterium]|nr:hypothetical protein [Candidatus Cloacimonadota bacterium]
MIAVYIDGALEKFSYEIHYTFDFIFKTLGYEHKYISKLDQFQANDILVYYGLIEPTSKEAYILALDKIFFFIPCEIDLLQPGKLTAQELQEYSRTIRLDKIIPILSKTDFQNPIVYFINEVLYYGSFKVDLIGNTFFHLVNYQKFTPGLEKNEFQIPDEEMIFCDHALIPYVNYYLWILEQSILEAVNSKRDNFLVKKELWPNAQPGAVALSHNVYRLQKWSFKRMMKSVWEEILQFYNIKFVFKNILSKLKFIITNLEEYWNFDLISKLEEKYEVKSTYFWGTTNGKTADFDYNINNSDVQKQISEIIDKGNEVALFATSNSYNNDNFQRQKNHIVQMTLREKVGVRLKDYKSDPYQTNELKLKQSFAYDSSAKFHSIAGFSGGIGFPYHLMVPQNNSGTKVFANNNNLEIPIICSEESFLLSKTNKISYEDAREIIEKIFDSIKMVNGMITLDFSIHNFTELEYAEKLLEDVLIKIKASPHYTNTYLSIADWWKKRERIEIREKRTSIELYFPERIDQFSFSVKGNKTISHLDQEKYQINDGIVTVSNIKADTTIRVFLNKPPKQTQ